MTSIKTQLPYEYYSLKFCEPKGEREYKIENLGLFIHCSTSYLFYICLNLLQESFYMETISVYRLLSIMSSFTASFFFFKVWIAVFTWSYKLFGTEENKGFFFTPVMKLCLKSISSSCYILLTIYLLFNFIFNLQVRFSEVTELSILLMR